MKIIIGKPIEFFFISLALFGHLGELYEAGQKEVGGGLSSEPDQPTQRESSNREKLNLNVTEQS